MISNTQLTTLIGSIYDAAADPGKWSQFLATLSEMTDGSCAMLIMHEAKIPKHTVSSSWGFDPKALRLYQARAYQARRIHMRVRIAQSHCRTNPHGIL
jgi:hypothetical protein